jgi:hypothetical protein
MTKTRLSALSLLLLSACTNNQAQPMTMNDLAPTQMVDAGLVGQHGTVVDYFTAQPMVGFTVTDGTSTTTTGADGTFLLPAPMGTVLAPLVTGPSYSNLQLAPVMAAGDDVNLGTIPIPSSMTFGTEQQIIASDPSKAVVQVAMLKADSCASVVGGTITVNSPSGTSVAYFDNQALPLASSMIDTMHGRPAAVIFNVTPGAKLDLTFNHPSCKQAPEGTAIGGAMFTEAAKTLAAEPGDNNTALVIVAE